MSSLDYVKNSWIYERAEYTKLCCWDKTTVVSNIARSHYQSIPSG